MSLKAVLSVWILNFVLAGISGESLQNIQVMQILSEQAENCGDVPFNISWTPDQLSPFGSVTINVDYIVPHDCDGGTYNVTAYFHKDKQSFIGYADTFTCDQIVKYIQCPLKKGAHIHVSKKISNLDPLGAYPGDYDVIAIIKNRKGEQMICVKAHIVIKEY